MWTPDLNDHAPTLSGKLLATLKRDIASGVLEAGARLPTHRDLAYRLGVGIGTVTAVYAEAARLGLIDARVGRGSFIRAIEAPRQAEGPVALSHNIPPLEHAERRFAATLATLRGRADILDTLAYAPPEGVAAHRRSGVAWLQRRIGLEKIDLDRFIITAGAQQAMALAFHAVCRPGDTILTEAATFFGVKTLAGHAGYRLRGLAMDEDGILPEALDRAAASGVRVLYTMPTLQNPTGRIMGLERRQEIASLVRTHGLWVIEDDVYGVFAAGNAPAPLVTLVPDRTIYISSLSKALAPGLRTGYLLVPSIDSFERVTGAVRALSYAPPSLGSLVASQWIDDGTADRIVDEMADELRARNALARNILGGAAAPSADDRCPHLWLPMPELEAERFSSRSLRAGIAVTPPSAPIVAADLISGVRICLGAVPTRSQLASALVTLANALTVDQNTRMMALI